MPAEPTAQAVAAQPPAAGEEGCDAAPAEPGDALALVVAPPPAPALVMATTRGRPAAVPTRPAGAWTQAFLNLLNGVGFLREPTEQPRTKRNKKDYALTVQARARVRARVAPGRLPLRCAALQADFFATIDGVRAAMQARGMLVTHQELVPGSGHATGARRGGGGGSATTVHHVLHDPNSLLILEKDGVLALCLSADEASELARAHLRPTCVRARARCDASTPSARQLVDAQQLG